MMENGKWKMGVSFHLPFAIFHHPAPHLPHIAMARKSNVPGAPVALSSRDAPSWTLRQPLPADALDSPGGGLFIAEQGGETGSQFHQDPRLSHRSAEPGRPHAP